MIQYERQFAVVLSKHLNGRDMLVWPPKPWANKV